MALPTISGRLLSFANAADAITGEQHIEHIRWVGPGTGTDVLSITNTAGDEIAAAVCSTGLDDQNIPMYGFPTEGIIIATMGSGKAMVYIRPGR